MMEIRFDWNQLKSRRNELKHGVTFEEAIECFYDSAALVIADIIHSVDEERFILIGRSDGGRLLVIVHVYRDMDSVIRLISARAATNEEEIQYIARLR